MNSKTIEGYDTLLHRKIMSLPKVSLVFPCWHAAQHMPHVLEDLQAQTFKDFEAILVSDGDDSQLEAMEAIAAKDSRIRIVRLEKNGGVAAARNAGMDAVTTEWVTYPDPDDRLGPNYVRSLFEAVDGKDVQMACGGFRKVKVDTGETLYFYPDIDGSLEILDMVDGYEKMFAQNIHWWAWNKLYSMEIIRKHGLKQDIRFSNVNEDHQFNLRYFPNVKKVCLIKDCDYSYLQYGNMMQETSRYHSNFMQMWQGVIDLSVHYHRQIGWNEERIEREKKLRTLAGIRFTFMKLFFLKAHLSITEATTELQKEYFDHSEYVNIIKQGHFGKNLLLRLIQLLTHTNSARTTAIIFSAIGFVARILNKSVN